MLQVTEIINPYNGKTVDLQLDGAPSGDLTVFVSRIPNDYGKVASAQSLGGNKYRVTLPEPVERGYALEPFYFTVHDSNGYSVHRDDVGYLQGQAVCWVGTECEDDLTYIMKKLLWRIIDNKPAIESRLRMIEPDCTLKQIIWGMGEKIDAYPAIELNQVALSEPYEGTNRYRIGKVKASMYGYIVHQTPTVEAELVTAFGRSVQRILNQEAYEQMPILNGQVLAACQAENLSFDNNVWNGSRFVSNFELDWSGEYGETLR